MIYLVVILLVPLTVACLEPTLGNGSYNIIGKHKCPFTQKKIKFYRNINLDLFFSLFRKFALYLPKSLGSSFLTCQFEILITYFRDIKIETTSSCCLSLLKLPLLPTANMWEYRNCYQQCATAPHSELHSPTPQQPPK